jgi:hypothetical protein
MPKKSNKHHLKDNTDEILQLPHLDSDLIDALDQRFPEQSADLLWSDRDVWFKSGQRSVIRFLYQQLKEQEENIL